jgi:hypothetical protein
MKDSRYVARFRPTLDLEFPITRKEHDGICNGNPALQALVEQRAVNALIALLKGSKLHPLEAFVSMDKWTYATVSEDVRRRIDKVRAWQEKRREKRRIMSEEETDARFYGDEY